MSLRFYLPSADRALAVLLPVTLSIACAKAPQSEPLAAPEPPITGHQGSEPQASIPPAMPTTNSTSAENHSMSHETKHNGVLKMAMVNGVHLHSEVVVHPDGHVMIFASDAKGSPIAPTEVSGSITCEKKETHAKSTQQLAANQTEGSVEAKCPGLSGLTTLSYALVIRGTPVTNSLEVPATGTPTDEHDDHAAGGEHHHD